MNDSRVVEDFSIDASISAELADNPQYDGDNENSSDEKKMLKIVNEKRLKKSSSDIEISDNQRESKNVNASQSLGANDLPVVNSEDDDEPFSDAQTEIQQSDPIDQLKNVFVSAAISIDYANCPPTSKYIRGDNIVSCWAMRPVEGDDNSSYFEWLLCIDLKGSLPKYVLNTVSIVANSLDGDKIIFLYLGFHIDDERLHDSSQETNRRIESSGGRDIA